MIKYRWMFIIPILILTGCGSPGLEGEILSPQEATARAGSKQGALQVTATDVPTFPPAVPAEDTVPATDPTLSPTRRPDDSPSATAVHFTKTPTLIPHSPTSTYPPTPSPQPPPTAPADPFIIRFEASVAQIDPGDSLALTWEAIGDEAVIYRAKPDGVFTDDHHEVGLAGTLTVTPPKDVRLAVKYVLYVERGDKGIYGFVEIAVTCPDTWFFGDGALPAPADYDDCPAGPPAVTAGAIQHFEHGLMFWRQDTDDIYFIVTSERWGRRPNAWKDGMPESDPDITPPEGLYQPVRGFGVLWREGDGWYGGLRDSLGWAVEPEYAIEITYQCSTFPDVRYQMCYVHIPDGVFYHGGHMWGFLDD